MSDIIDQQAEDAADSYVVWGKLTPKDYVIEGFKRGARRKITSAEIEAATRAIFTEYGHEVMWESVTDEEAREDWKDLAKAALRSIGHEIEGDE